MGKSQILGGLAHLKKGGQPAFPATSANVTALQGYADELSRNRFQNHFGHSVEDAMSMTHETGGAAPDPTAPVPMSPMAVKVMGERYEMPFSAPRAVSDLVEGGSEFVIPQDALDVGLTVAGAPLRAIGPLARGAAAGLGYGISSDEAEASPLAKIRKAIKAYHGSPHDFDRFDMSKIGTGEGAQAYGHGLYFAENEGVAKGYRDALAGAGKSLEWNGKKLEGREFFSAVDDIANQDWRLGKIVDAAGRFGPKHALDSFEPHTRNASDGPEWAAAMQKFRDGAGASASGRMYEVRINADPEQFLDWDKPLSEQSEAVRRGVGSIYGMEPNDIDFAGDPFLDRPGQKIYETISDGFNRELGDKGSSGVANKLREAGIPGIKYLDAGSRSAGDGSRNYVVFDDKLVEIVKKYGWAPGMAIPAAMAAEIQQAQEQSAPPEMAQGGAVESDPSTIEALAALGADPSINEALRALGASA